MAGTLLCPACGGPLDPAARACPHCGVTSSSRRCGVCLDLNLAGDRNCRRCGARLPEEDSGARADGPGCPGCGARMTPRRLANLCFDECDACGGLWLPPGAAEALAAEAETRAGLRAFDAPAPSFPGPTASPCPAPAETAGGTAPIVYRPCPACHRMMNRTQYAHGSGVVVDICRDHGSWFDRGEVTRIVAFVESGGLERARRREAEALKSDLRDLRRRAIAARGGMEAPVPGDAQPSGPAAMELFRWIAGYLAGGKRSENSG